MWMDIGIVALFVVAIYAFVQLVGWRTRSMSRRSNRTAESLYDTYADSPRKQRRFARQHGGSSTDEQHKE
jgi:predicted negative regulator of RcsB-dependent stress response